MRSSDFWFQDDTVVLQVENTLYRVYRGLLMARSTVFHDTFSISQPENEGNHMEGCPVVQLHDKGEDFTRFLKALHQYGTYKNCPVSGFFELWSALRLSDKYDIPVLRHLMISILREIYPSTLKEWATRKPPPRYTAHVGNHLSEMSIRRILPAVMYAVCYKLTLNLIVSGYGTALKIKIQNKEYQNRCILAIPRLMVAQRNSVGYVTVYEDIECNDPSSCNTEPLLWLALDLDDEDTLNPLTNHKLGSRHVFAVCPSCLESARETCQDARDALWEELPEIFDLGTWEELLE
ncbi:hypothetical protein DFH09DRAFT_905327 [Mycena vulgaris]|nr:hypothetical protein DFH09DRAFT_905327 [Mycena vulgaris]